MGRPSRGSRVPARHKPPPANSLVPDPQEQNRGRLCQIQELPTGQCGILWCGGICDFSGTIRSNVICRNWIQPDDSCTPDVPLIGCGISVCYGIIEYNVISENYNPNPSLVPLSAAGLRQCSGVMRGNIITRNGGDALSQCVGTIDMNVSMHNEDYGLSSCWDIITRNFIMCNDGGGVGYCSGPIEANIISGNHDYAVRNFYFASATISNNLFLDSHVGARRDCP